MNLCCDDDSDYGAFAEGEKTIDATSLEEAEQAAEELSRKWTRETFDDAAFERKEQTMDSVGGDSWCNGVTVWKVTYGFADAGGGGEQVDYFKTVNCRTPPTGAGIEGCLNSDKMTVLNIEGIEFLWTDTPDDPVSQQVPPNDSAHRKIFDLTGDKRGAAGRIDVGE